MYQGDSGLFADHSTKNGIPFIDYYATNSNEQVSFLQFLSDNESTYEDALLKVEDQGVQNYFGI